MIQAMNKWYDSVQEPWRMLIMLAVVLALVLTVNFINQPIGFILLVLIIAQRMFYVYKKRT